MGKRKGFLPFIIAVPIIIAVLIAFNVCCGVFESYITPILCGTGEDFSSATETLASSDELVRKIQEDASVLLRNKDNALPLGESERKLNVLGSASSDKYFLLKGVGSGSSTINAAKEITLMDALDSTVVKNNWNDDVKETLANERKFTVNQDLKDFYAGLSLNRPTPGSNSGSYNLAEPTLTQVQAHLTNEDYSNPAVVVISRNGGENIGEIPDAYLRLTSAEEELMDFATQNFPKVIVLINSCNAMHLGFLETYDVDAAFYVGLPGQSGTVALNKLLTGEVTPSGKLTDTYVYTPDYDPTYANRAPASNHIQYVEDIYYGYKWYETADAEGYFDHVTTEYGSRSGYGGIVQYPFGYGESYTQFDWALDHISVDGTIINGKSVTLTAESKVEITVKVTNTGDFDGKDVVELYYTPPYTSGGIEKAAVNLLDFAKTPTIAADADDPSAYVSLSFSAYDLASYDCYDKNENGFAGYELEAGTYEIKLMTDSHNLKDFADNIITCEVADDIRFEVDPVTQNEVKNRFTGSDAYAGVPMDGSTVGAETQYLTREDFAGTFPTAHAKTPSNSAEVSKASDYLNPVYDTATMPTQGEAGDLRLTVTENNVTTFNKELLMRLSGVTEYNVDDETEVAVKDDEGNDTGETELVNEKYNEEKAKYDTDTWENNRKEAYDSDLWESLLNQITVSELKNLVDCGGFRTQALDSVGKPVCADYDGPAGFNTNTINGGGSGEWTAFQSESLIGCSWNKTLLLEMGLAVGAEAAATNVNGWYAPGVNLHRSAYTARNFEYYSEDGVLSGKLAAQIIWGAKVNGLYCYIKHFCLSEPGPNPRSLNTWVTEQNFRENYLKPFEIAVKEGKANAVMTAFNRVGGTWAGANYAMNVEVLRDEWGFRGSLITDWCQGGDGIGGMNIAQGVRAGNDIWLNPTYSASNGINANSATEIACARRAAHNVLWTYVDTWRTNFDHNKDYEGGIVSEVKKKNDVFRWWIILLVAIDVLAVGGCVFWGLKVFLFKKNKEAKPAKQTSADQSEDE